MTDPVTNDELIAARQIRAEFEYTPAEVSEGLKAIVRQRLAGRYKSRRLLAGLLGWFLFIVLAVLFFTLIDKHSGAGHVPPAPAASQVQPFWLSLILQLGPWIGIFAFVWFVVIRLKWVKFGKTNLLLDRRWTLIADASGLVMSNAQERGERSWSLFTAAGQTKNLYLLHVEKAYAVIIPKRVFGTAADSQAFWELAQSQIGPRISAFPVLPAK